MPTRHSVIELLDSELHTQDFPDSSLNGLQIEGSEEISSVAVAVDAGLAVLEAAISRNVTLLIVHHGMIWDRPFAITNSYKRKVALAIENGLNLYASHLPLDAHPTLGNNFGLAALLGLSNARAAVPHRDRLIGCVAENQRGSTLKELAERVSQLPGASGTLTLPFGPSIPERICVVTGAGADTLQLATREGFDTLITGEPRQSAYHYAQEHSLNLICGGHYATETIGVQALGRLLEQRFSLPWSFIDHPTGI